MYICFLCLVFCFNLLKVTNNWSISIQLEFNEANNKLWYFQQLLLFSLLFSCIQKFLSQFCLGLNENKVCGKFCELWKFDYDSALFIFYVHLKSCTTMKQL